mmetsp:Transcript_8837/g.23871  ORF Transcript_8837/g.23871 Transcript_8837/m.23871 type:complete len:240 (-) Transcript_8837:207-926(-)
MSLDATEFLFVDQVEESGLEFSDLSRCCCDGHCLLSSAQQDVVLVFADDGIVDWTIRLVRLEVLEVDGVVELGREVCRRCDEEGLFEVELEPVDLLLVSHEFVDDLSRFRIVESDVSVIHADQQMLVEVGPGDVGSVYSLGLLGDVNFFDRFCVVGFDVEDADLGVVLDERIRDGGKSLVVLGPCDAAHWSAVRKCLETLPSFAAPQFARCIGARREQMLAESIAIQVPDGTLVTSECS